MLYSKNTISEYSVVSIYLLRRLICGFLAEYHLKIAKFISESDFAGHPSSSAKTKLYGNLVDARSHLCRMAG